MLTFWGPLVSCSQRGGAQHRGVAVSPRDVIAAAAPDPNEMGKRYVGQTCAGTWLKGRKEGMAREIYLYQVTDNHMSVGN